MSVLGLQSLFTITDPVFAGRYVSSGAMSSNTVFPATINNAEAGTIFTFNTNLMPIIGNNYFVSLSAGISGLTGVGTSSNGSLLVGLSYNNLVVSAQTVPPITTGAGIVTLSGIVQRVASPANPLTISLTNYSGSNITAGETTLTSLNVIEVPTPQFLVDSNIRV